MKKTIAFILAIFAIVISSCNTRNHNYSSTNLTDDIDIISLYDENNDVYLKITICKYEYNGHMYQRHHFSGSHAGTCGIVHDPDCPCFKRTETQEN